MFIVILKVCLNLRHWQQIKSNTEQRGIYSLITRTSAKKSSKLSKMKLKFGEYFQVTNSTRSVFYIGWECNDRPVNTCGGRGILCRNCCNDWVTQRPYWNHIFWKFKMSNTMFIISLLTYFTFSLKKRRLLLLWKKLIPVMFRFKLLRSQVLGSYIAFQKEIFSRRQRLSLS